jgi:predicted nuclease with TOPRIM domain
LAALQSDYDNLNARYEEESETASTLRASFSKISAEYAALKTKYDKELMAKQEEQSNKPFK